MRNNTSWDIFRSLSFPLLGFLFLSACADSKLDFTAKHWTLDNGAQLIVLPDYRFPIITQMIWYPVGSGDEVSPKTGLAHYLEHLMFQNQNHLAQGGFSSIIEALGGRNNAFTSYDYTAYYQRFHPDQIETVMSLEAERMTELNLSTRAALKERNVIIEEYHTRLNSDPIAALRVKMNAALYGKSHPYGRDIIGALEDIKTLAKQDADAFYKTYYAPARAIIVIAGDIETERAYALAQKHYGALKSAATKQAPLEAKDFPPVLQRQNERALIFHRDERVRQALLMRTYTTANRHLLGPRQTASFEVLAEILVGAASAKLNRLFVDDKKRASFVDGGLHIDRRGPGAFSVELWLAPQQKLNPSNLKAIYLELDEALKNTFNQEQAITQEDLSAAKNRLRASAIYLKDNQFRLANFVGSWLATGHNLESAQKWASYIEAVSLDDVRQAASYMLSGERAVSGFLLPKKS